MKVMVVLVLAIVFDGIAAAAATAGMGAEENGEGGDDGVMMMDWLLPASGTLVATALALVVWHRLRSFGISGENGRSVSVVRGSFPFFGCGFSFVKNPTAFLTAQRRLHETFATYLFGVRILFTFSPQGLKSLYGFRESDASFTEATKGLLSLKLPQEILSENDLRKFHHGLKPRLMAKYITYANVAVKQRLSNLPSSGQVDLFAFMKTVVHAIGMTCWVGPKALEDKYFSKLVAAYETLDPEDGFQDLRRLASTIVLRRTRETRALDSMEAVLKDIWLDQGGVPPEGEDIEDNLANLHDLHRQLPDSQRYRQVAIDVFHFELASQANMYAGMAWTLVHLLKEDRGHMQRVMRDFEDAAAKHGEDFIQQGECLDKLVYVEAVILESLRMAQQSITLRKAMRDLTMETECGSVHVPRGWYIGTLLSVTNTDPKTLPSVEGIAPLDTFDPNRFLSPSHDKIQLQAPEGVSRGAVVGVSMFGHGVHSCPGRRFALNMTKICLYHVLSGFELTPEFDTPVPPPSSVGALARVIQPCTLTFRRRNEGEHRERMQQGWAQPRGEDE